MTNEQGKPGPVVQNLPYVSTVNQQVFNTDLLIAADYVEKVNRANGWYENERSFGDEIALIASELFEAFEAYRVRGLKRWVTDEEGTTWLVGEPDDANGDPVGLQAYPDGMKPEGVPSEIADTFVRLLDLCRRAGINLGEEFWAKMAFNETRGHRHGGKKL